MRPHKPMPRRPNWGILADRAEDPIAKHDNALEMMEDNEATWMRAL